MSKSEFNAGSAWIIRDCSPSDYEQVLGLNSASTPMVNEISLEDLQSLATMSSYFKVAVNSEQEIVGVLLVLPHGQTYKSLNYQWFNSRYENFNYVDRVFVRKDFIGRGLGKCFYQDLLTHHSSAGDVDYICCEVNIKPMNEPSLLFHRQLGFVEVGQRDSAEDKRVSLLLKTL